jgi:membrane protein DedA with SNARE-associated domain
MLYAGADSLSLAVFLFLSLMGFTCSVYMWQVYQQKHGNVWKEIEALQSRHQRPLRHKIRDLQGHW